jgi:hypothetical protein
MILLFFPAFAAIVVIVTLSARDYFGSKGNVR